MLDPDLGDSIWDPACGTAGFLITPSKHLAKYSAEPREVPFTARNVARVADRHSPRRRKEIPNLQTYRKGAAKRSPIGMLGAPYGIEVSGR